MQLSTTLSRIVIGAALAAGAQAAMAQQQLVPAQSEVRFTARQMGVPLEGQFPFEGFVCFQVLALFHRLRPQLKVSFVEVRYLHLVSEYQVLIEVVYPHLLLYHLQELFRFDHSL